MTVPELYLIYGSQTGNSESIAKDMAEMLLLKNVENKVMSLNAFKAMPPPAADQKFLLLVFCSTTGNGDCPENADGWWRSTKLRSAPKDKFANCQFSVLALGDTNYDKFCFMGKSIDKRLGELGGERIQPLMCVDEATGLEESVEKWKASTFAMLDEIYCSAQGCCEAEAPAVESKEEHEDVRCIMKHRSLTKKECEVDALDFHLNSLPEGLKPAMYFVDALHMREFVASQALEDEEKARPARRGVAELTAQIVSSGGVGEAKGVEPAPLFHSMMHPFHAPVMEARWLTSTDRSRESLFEGMPGRYDWGEDKRVVFCKLNLVGSNIHYAPGDSIGVCCPNPPYAVKMVMRRLQQVHAEEALAPETQVLLSGAKVPQSLQEILQYHFDLSSAPKKSTIKALARCCRDESEKKLMQIMCGKELLGKHLWNHFIEQQHLGIAEALQLFPSCLPTMAQLFAALSPQVPRYYSIATSPLCDAQSVGFAFSALRYTCEVTNEENGLLFSVRRSGVCTLYLEHALRSWLHPHAYPATEPESVRVRIFHKPTHCFHLPGNLGVPLILVGPGTGVAPFMSFLSHRSSQQHRKRSGEIMSTGLWRGGFELDELDLPCEGNCVEKFMSSVCPGPIMLFYGCRNDHDFLFEQELKGFARDHVLESLDVAMSRKQEDKIYVTHHLRQRASQLAQLILTRGAHVYICGDGNKMAKDVMQVLREVLEQHGDMSAEAAAAFVADMQHRHRLLLDIWSA